MERHLRPCLGRDSDSERVKGMFNAIKAHVGAVPLEESNLFSRRKLARERISVCLMISARWWQRRINGFFEENRGRFLRENAIGKLFVPLFPSIAKAR